MDSAFENAGAQLVTGRSVCGGWPCGLVELSFRCWCFALMARAATYLAVRARVRFVLLVMLAVVTSMTLHHGAMASPSGVPFQAMSSQHHHHQEACFGDCSSHTHSMAVCCGTGQCLSSLPAAPRPIAADWHMSPDDAELVGLGPRWLSHRIERPPKRLSLIP